MEVKVVTGRLGWGNSGCNSLSSLDVYGPGDRFARPGQEQSAPPYGGRSGSGGDVLADALAREGLGEGARLVIVAWDRFQGDPEVIEAAVRAAVEALDTEDES